MDKAQLIQSVQWCLYTTTKRLIEIEIVKRDKCVYLEAEQKQLNAEKDAYQRCIDILKGLD